MLRCATSLLTILLAFPSVASYEDSPEASTDSVAESETYYPHHAEYDGPELVAEVIDLEGGTLYLDPAHLDQREELTDAIQVMLDVMHHQREPVTDDVIQAQAEHLSQIAIQTIGIEADDALQTMLVDIATGLFKTFHFHSPSLDGPLVCYILSRDHTKAFLRQGGSLPFLSYDAETDRASYHFQLSITGNQDEAPQWDRSLRESMALTILTSESHPPLEFIQLYTGIFESPFKFFAQGITANLASDTESEDVYPAIIMRQLIEIALIRSINRHNIINYRWFSDGFANALAEIAIVEAGYPEAASLFSRYHDARFQTPDSAINLRYWSMSKYSVDLHNSLATASRLTSARQAYAYVECNRLLDEIGLEAIQAMMREFQHRDIVDSQHLNQFIEEITGYDIAARLDLYQSTPDEEALYSDIFSQFSEVAYLTDPTPEQQEQAVMALLRAYEIRINSERVSGQILMITIERLGDMDDIDAMEELYESIESSILTPPDHLVASEHKLSWLGRRCLFALEHNRLESAHQLAERWLEQAEWDDTTLNAAVRLFLLIIDADAKLVANDVRGAGERITEARTIFSELSFNPDAESQHLFEQYIDHIESRVNQALNRE